MFVNTTSSGLFQFVTNIYSLDIELNIVLCIFSNSELNLDFFYGADGGPTISLLLALTENILQNSTKQNS